MRRNDLPLEEQVIKLLWWNKFWMSMLIFVVVDAVLVFWGFSVINNIQSLKMSVSGNEVNFSSSSDGPFVVTHFFDFSSGAIYAELPKPKLYFDSGGMLLTKEELGALQWRTKYGEDCPAPASLNSVRAVYSRPYFLKVDKETGG